MMKHFNKLLDFCIRDKQHSHLEKMKAFQVFTKILTYWALFRLKNVIIETFQNNS